MTRLLFFKLLAILVYMPLCPLSDYELYWSRDVLYYNSFTPSIMSRNTFKSILTFLHVSVPDPTIEASNDWLWKVRILLDKLNANCQAYYFPQKYVSIDERMVKTKDGFQCASTFVTNQPNGA